MVKPTSNSVQITVTVTLFAVVWTPLIALAHDGEDHAATTTKGFCERLPELQSHVTGEVTARNQKYESNKSGRLQKLTENRGTQDSALTTDRGEWDQNRIDRYAKLYERATTTAQKTAIDAFKTAIEGAVAARRAAIDTAIKTYRSGIDAAIAARQSGIAAAQTTLENAVGVALNTAASDCAAGKDQKTVRTNTLAALKAARTAFQTSVKSLDKNDAVVKTLKDTRNAAVKKAIADFKTARDAATKDLKAAFKQQ